MRELLKELLTALWDCAVAVGKLLWLVLRIYCSDGSGRAEENADDDFDERALMNPSNPDDPYYDSAVDHEYDPDYQGERWWKGYKDDYNEYG